MVEIPFNNDYCIAKARWRMTRLGCLGADYRRELNDEFRELIVIALTRLTLDRISSGIFTGGDTSPRRHDFLFPNT